MSDLAPGFLVAVPQLLTPDFQRTVTLLIESDAEGSFGLILNRLSNLSLGQICADADLDCTRDIPVHVGGPVDPERAWLLHGPAYRMEESYRITDNVFLTANWETLGRLAVSNDPFQVYLGYAGWGEGQLENEIRDGTWLHSEVMEDLILRPANDLWRTVIQRMGIDPGRIGSGGGIH
jgi:putative transcriptional regulator